MESMQSPSWASMLVLQLILYLPPFNIFTRTTVLVSGLSSVAFLLLNFLVPTALAIRLSEVSALSPTFGENVTLKESEGVEICLHRKRRLRVRSELPNKSINHIVSWNLSDFPPTMFMGALLPFSEVERAKPYSNHLSVVVVCWFFRYAWKWRRLKTTLINGER